MAHHCNIEPVSCEELIDLHISKTKRVLIINEYGRDEERDKAIRKITKDIFYSVISHPDIFIYTKKYFHYRYQYFKSLEPKSIKLVEGLVEGLVDSFLRGDDPPICFNKTELVQAFSYYGEALPEAESLPTRSQQEDYRLWLGVVQKLKQEADSLADGGGGTLLDDPDGMVSNEEHARQWRELAETLQGKERKAALCAACKWEGMTHIETYDAFSLGNAKKDKSKREAVTRLKPVAEALKSKYGHLEMPEWRAA